MMDGVEPAGGLHYAMSPTAVDCAAVGPTMPNPG